MLLEAQEYASWEFRVLREVAQTYYRVLYIPHLEAISYAHKVWWTQSIRD